MCFSAYRFVFPRLNAQYRKRYARVTGSAMRPSSRIVCYSAVRICRMTQDTASGMRKYRAQLCLFLALLTSLRKNDYQSFYTRSPSSGSHRYRTILQPVAKALFYKAFLSFWGEKLSEKIIQLFANHWGLNPRQYRMLDVFLFI